MGTKIDLMSSDKSMTGDVQSEVQHVLRVNRAVRGQIMEYPGGFEMLFCFVADRIFKEREISSPSNSRHKIRVA